MKFYSASLTNSTLSFFPDQRPIRHTTTPSVETKPNIIIAVSRDQSRLSKHSPGRRPPLARRVDSSCYYTRSRAGRLNINALAGRRLVG
ncbi:hypothetical protein NP493_330g04005 [Ridgeia piscesae]|uniref:Uncharacterized protein n=1 Tax=Ridgeia piscesae TaxID=27915 RepID=A0AAD9NVT2_RIDPI|nr:hypothetical protein NP493_330g04005 [Ridgeia piscesae]